VKVKVERWSITEAVMRSFLSGVWIPITVREPAEGTGEWDCGWFYFKDVAKEIKTYIHSSTVKVQGRVIWEWWSMLLPGGGTHVARAKAIGEKMCPLRWNQVQCSHHPGRNPWAMLGGSLGGFYLYIRQSSERRGPLRGGLYLTRNQPNRPYIYL